MQKRRGTQHASAETRLGELLDAAQICFGRNGYVGTTIDHIAIQANLSKGSVYRFFGSKDDILIALLDRYEQHIADVINKAMPDNATPVEQIRISQRASLEVLSAVPEMLSVWQEFQHHDHAKKRILAIFTDARDKLEKLIGEGIAAGDLHDQPHQAVIDLLMSTNEGLLALANAQVGFDPLSRFDDLWPLIKRGLS